MEYNLNETSFAICGNKIEFENSVEYDKIPLHFKESGGGWTFTNAKHPNFSDDANCYKDNLVHPETFILDLTNIEIHGCFTLDDACAYCEGVDFDFDESEKQKYFKQWQTILANLRKYGDHVVYLIVNCNYEPLYIGQTKCAGRRTI
eukprot:Pgem_evm1s20220